MIKINALQFSYKQKDLYQNLSFELNKGSITGLLGKNGAGKTTLLKLIGGLTFPKAGSIEVMDHDPKKREPSFLEKIYFVPEEFYLPPVSIKTYLKAHVPVYPRFDQDIFEQVLLEFELARSSSLNKMSYGQKKKFLISFALASKCQLLLLDEPTNGLDIPSKGIFRRVMASTLGEDQLVLISTHQVRDVENLIDKVLILDEGQMVLESEILDISSQLNFTTASHQTEALYSEPAPGGYRIISPSEGKESHVDLELLFNAVVSGSKLFDDVNK